MSGQAIITKGKSESITVIIDIVAGDNMFYQMIEATTNPAANYLAKLTAS